MEGLGSGFSVKGRARADYLRAEGLANQKHKRFGLAKEASSAPSPEQRPGPRARIFQQKPAAQAEDNKP